MAKPTKVKFIMAKPIMAQLIMVKLIIMDKNDYG